MMRFDPNKYPPGGWEFYEPETDWSLPKPMEHTFELAAKAIAAHRASNPTTKHRSSLAEAKNDLESFTRARLNDMQTETTQAEVNHVYQKSCRTCG